VRSLVIWDHTVLPATRQRWFSRLYPSILPVLIYRPRKDERLSWPRWLVIPRWFTRPQTVTHPSINRARCRVTPLIETNALPISQATTTSNVHGKPVTLLFIWTLVHFSAMLSQWFLQKKPVKLCANFAPVNTWVLYSLKRQTHMGVCCLRLLSINSLRPEFLETWYVLQLNKHNIVIMTSQRHKPTNLSKTQNSHGFTQLH